MAKTTVCDECNGTGKVRPFEYDGALRDKCPWCDGAGEQPVVYVVKGHGFNGDYSFTEVYDVVTSLSDARRVARTAMDKRHEHALADGTPTLQWMEVTGPGIEESLSLHVEVGADTRLVWSGEDDEKVRWSMAQAEGRAVATLLEGEPEGAEFTLGTEGGRAYRATYRKNADGTWDQLPGTCEAPNVINMDARHLGFCVGLAVVRKALEARS